MLMALWSSKKLIALFRSSYKALEMKEKFHYAFMVLSRAVAPQASYHNTGSILAKILNFDDDVVEYRRWVNKHWENKVPRIKIVEPSPVIFKEKVFKFMLTYFSATSSAEK